MTSLKAKPRGVESKNSECGDVIDRKSIRWTFWAKEIFCTCAPWFMMDLYLHKPCCKLKHLKYSLVSSRECSTLGGARHLSLWRETEAPCHCLTSQETIRVRIRPRKIKEIWITVSWKIQNSKWEYYKLENICILIIIINCSTFIHSALMVLSSGMLS